MKKERSASTPPPGRRTFIQNMILGAFSAFLTPAQLLSGQKIQSPRVKKDGMFYRRLGRTNLFISEISLGGSPVPAKPILYQAIERGVNYIDSSHTYMNGNSERQIGQLLKDVGRDKVHVGTKFHLRRNWSEKSIIGIVEGSLRRLKTDFLDVLLIHGASDEKHLTDERVLGAFERLKKQGKYRFRGLSCHSNHHKVVKEAVECGIYDMVQLGYNVFDIQDTKKEIETYEDYLGQSGIRHLLALAKSKDIGVIAQKTLKVGGKRQNLEKYKTGTTSIFQAMLKWVLENKNVTSALTEMLTYEQLEEDLAVVGETLSERERTNLFRFVAENSKNYCHMCGLCEMNCPSLIKTASILRYLAYYEDYGKAEFAKQAYSHLKPTESLHVCQNCGECERACLYGVSVRERLGDASRILGA